MGNCGLKPKALGDDEAAPPPAPAEAKGKEAPTPAEETSRAIEVVTPTEEATSTAAEPKEVDEPKEKEPAAPEGGTELPASAPATVA